MRTILFLLGSPGSGTEHVRRLLALHPRIATTEPTRLFADFIGSAMRCWRFEVALKVDRNGVAPLLEEADFIDWCKVVAEFVVERVEERRQDAEVVLLEEHFCPEGFPQVATRIFPQACFWHVLRDPTEAVPAALAEAKTRGASHQLFPRSVADAARLWRRTVEGFRSIGQLVQSYQELRYEALLARGSSALTPVLSSVGLEPAATAEGLQVHTTSHSMARTSASRQALIAHVCGPLLDELGYTRASRRAPRARLFLHDLLGRIGDSVDWRLASLARRL